MFFLPSFYAFIYVRNVQDGSFKSESHRGQPLSSRADIISRYWYTLETDLSTAQPLLVFVSIKGEEEAFLLGERMASSIPYPVAESGTFTENLVVHEVNFLRKVKRHCCPQYPTKQFCLSDCLQSLIAEKQVQKENDILSNLAIMFCGTAQDFIFLFMRNNN